MSDAVLLFAATIANVLIALAYLAIGVYVAPKFSLGTVSNTGAKAAKWSGMAFFVACGFTHLELAYHANEPADLANPYAIGDWFTSWHGFLIHGTQAVAGFLFLFLAIKYLSVRIYNRTFYERMIEEYIAEMDALAPPVNSIDMKDPDHANWIAMLGDVIENENVQMVYQPIVSLATQKVAGYESLARFPDYPEMTPEQWFVAAERFGKARDLEITCACKALEEVDRLPKGTYLTINVSQDTFMSNDLHIALDDSMVATHRYVLELTEHVATVRYWPLKEAAQEHRHLGIRVAVDDVGSGFASMRRVVELQPEILKVDRSLSSDVVTDEHQRALIRAFVGYGRDVGVSVVVEGIETREQVRVLKSLGVRFGQGYYFGRPDALPSEKRTA